MKPAMYFTVVCFIFSKTIFIKLFHPISKYVSHHASSTVEAQVITMTHKLNYLKATLGLGWLPTCKQAVITQCCARNNRSVHAERQRHVEEIKFEWERIKGPRQKEYPVEAQQEGKAHDIWYDQISSEWLRQIHVLQKCREAMFQKLVQFNDLQLQNLRKGAAVTLATPTWWFHAYCGLWITQQFWH